MNVMSCQANEWPLAVYELHVRCRKWRLKQLAHGRRSRTKDEPEIAISLITFHVGLGKEFDQRSLPCTVDVVGLECLDGQIV